MSRFLKNRKIWLLTSGIAVMVIFLMMRWWLFSAIVVIGVMLFLMVIWVDRETQMPMGDLLSNRKIRKIDTLIIGDWCSRRLLAQRFDLSCSLVLLAPERSERASFLILEHLASRLDGKNVCIIKPHRDHDLIGVYDIPYLSQLTKMELGLTNTPHKRLSFLLENPFALFRFLYSPFVNLHEAQIQNEDLMKYCERKGYVLTYLQK